MPGKKPTKKELDARIKTGRQKLAERQEELNEMVPTMPVRTLEEAKSPEVLKFCREFLVNGGRWDALRRELALGPAHLDHRWRTIRQLVPEIVAPVSETDALLRMNANQLYMMNELEGILGDAQAKFQSADQAEAALMEHLDSEPDPKDFEDHEKYEDACKRHTDKMKVLGAIAESKNKNTHNFLKIKLDALKQKFDENSREFQSYMDLKRLKAKEKGNQGTSILVQYNHIVNRPGDNPVEKDVGPKVERISEHDG